MRRFLAPLVALALAAVPSVAQTNSGFSFSFPVQTTTTLKLALTVNGSPYDLNSYLASGGSAMFQMVWATGSGTVHIVNASSVGVNSGDPTNVASIVITSSQVSDTAKWAATFVAGNQTWTGTVLTLPFGSAASATTNGVVTAAVPPAATATTVGGVVLSGDLSGTASSPQVVASHLSAPLPQGQGGSGAATLGAGTVTPTGATAAIALGDVLQVVGYNLAYFLPVGYVRDCSVDYGTQIQAAITATQNSVVTHTLHLPDGCFKTTAALSTTGINIIGEGGAGFTGGTSEIDCYAAGACLTFSSATNSSGSRLEGFQLVSKAASQTGVIVLGSYGTVRNIGIRDFDTVGFQLGIASTTGAFYTNVSNILVQNGNTQGATGVWITGGTPASNANYLRNVVVNGKTTTMTLIDGTTNLIEGGDWDPLTSGGTVNTIWQINGAHNRISGAYTEMSGGSTVAPGKIVAFGSASDGNLVTGLRINYGNTTGKWAPTTHFQDLGYYNDVKISPIGFNFPVVPQSVTSQNLLPNSSFLAWDTVGARPVGWFNGGGVTLAQEATTVRGTPVSLSITGTAIAYNVQSYVFSPSVGDNSEKQVQIAQLQGQQVTCSVWCNSSFAGIGNVRVGSTGTGGASVGTVTHSGSGTWELLTASQLIPADSTKVWIEFRSSNGGGSLTGTVYYSEPTCVVGTTLPYYSPRPLTDNIAVMHGALALNPPLALTFGASIATDAKWGNQFSVTASSAAAFSFPNPTNLRTGQHVTYLIKNTSGGALAVPTWGVTFKLPTLVLPATGFNRTYDYLYDGTNLIFQWQSAADVPN